MTNEDLKDQIDLEITNKTDKNSVTPVIVGDNLKDIVDYIDQEVDTLEATIDNKTTKTSAIVSAVSSTSVDAGGGVLVNDYTTVLASGVNTFVAIDSSLDEIGKEYTVRNASLLPITIRFAVGGLVLEDESYNSEYILDVGKIVILTHSQLLPPAEKMFYASVIDQESTELVIDSAPIEDSTNPISSGAIYDIMSSVPDDANVVHKTGDESITGVKTFSDATGPAITLNNTNVSAIHGMQLTNSSAGHGLKIDNTSSGRGISLINSGSGIGINILNETTATTHGLSITNSSTTSSVYGLHVSGTGNAVAARFSSASNNPAVIIGTSGVVGLQIDYAHVSGSAILVNNLSTGDGVRTENSGAGNGFKAGNSAAGTSFLAESTTSSGNSFVGKKAGITTFRVDADGNLLATKLSVSALNTEPSTAGSTGTVGDIRITNGYIYVCVATNTWKRAALSTW